VATTKDASNNALTGRVITWSSSATDVATVSATGVVTGVSAGSATITATSEGQVGTATITVTAAPVASVSVTPPTLSVPATRTGTLAAVVKDGAGNVLVGRTVTWSSSAGSIASVSPTGVVSGLAEGTATITATSETKSGSATVTVTPAPVAAVAVSPASATINIDATTTLSATLTDANSNVLTGRTVVWSSTATDVATVSAAGEVTGVLDGSATITATSEGKSGSATITVLKRPVGSVTVTPSSASVRVGNSRSLTATVKDTKGKILSGITVVWTTSDASVAAVDTSGQVTGVAVGMATITATVDGKSDSAAITVTP
jgi:trimeric autotransporter adhesin